MARSEFDRNTLDWLDDVSTWPITASPVEDNYERIEKRHYPYHYFSPYRPMNFIGGQLDHMLVSSTEPYHDFVYTKLPLPAERIRAWQLVPMDEKTWAATGWEPEPPYEP